MRECPVGRCLPSPDLQLGLGAKPGIVSLGPPAQPIPALLLGPGSGAHPHPSSREALLAQGCALLARRPGRPFLSHEPPFLAPGPWDQPPSHLYLVTHTCPTLLPVRLTLGTPSSGKLSGYMLPSPEEGGQPQSRIPRRSWAPVLGDRSGSFELRPEPIRWRPDAAVRWGWGHRVQAPVGQGRLEPRGGQRRELVPLGPSRVRAKRWQVLATPSGLRGSWPGHLAQQQRLWEGCFVSRSGGRCLSAGWERALARPARGSGPRVPRSTRWVSLGWLRALSRHPIVLAQEAVPWQQRCPSPEIPGTRDLSPWSAHKSSDSSSCSPQLSPHSMPD